MTPVEKALLGMVAGPLFGSGCQLVSAAFTGWFYHSGRRAPGGSLVPMTLIKPVRGAHGDFEDNLVAVLEADPKGRLEVIVAMESAQDPGFVPATRVAALANARPGATDSWRVLVTGPSGLRMGKIHNMIEGLKVARHPLIVFSDADVRADRALLEATARAFEEGADAAWALPYAWGLTRLPDIVLNFAFNHFYCLGVPLMHRLGVFHGFAGGWMAYRKETISRAGGLEPLDRHIADDFALGQAVVRSGARVRLLGRVARIAEEAEDLEDVARHCLKWMRVIKYGAPWAYFLVPLSSPVFGALPPAAVGLLMPHPLWWPAAAFGFVCFMRAAAAWAQDRAVTGTTFPWWAYPFVPLSELAMIGLWALALPGNTIEWRGKTYRLRYGGWVEVVG